MTCMCSLNLPLHANLCVCVARVCMDLFCHVFQQKEECVTEEEDEGQMNETPWHGKKGVICPDIPEEEQSTPERGVHDENGTSSYN